MRGGGKCGGAAAGEAIDADPQFISDARPALLNETKSRILAVARRRDCRCEICVQQPNPGLERRDEYVQESHRDWHSIRRRAGGPRKYNRTRHIQAERRRRVGLLQSLRTTVFFVQGPGWLPE